MSLLHFAASFNDELTKLASKNSWMRRGRKPISVAKLLRKQAAPVPFSKRVYRAAPGAVALAGGSILGYEGLKGEYNKYRMGRQVHKQMQRRRQR